MDYARDIHTDDDHSIPLVSIICLAFNQERYVRQTFQGILDQQVSFPVEVLVHDDASTDGTTDVIREYAFRYPKLFAPIFQIENQHSRGVDPLSHVIHRARGRYLAFCEGDDYWTDPHKLANQVSILENHADVGLVYTDHSINLEEAGSTILSYRNSQAMHLRSRTRARPTGHVFEQLLLNNFVSTLTVVARKHVFIAASEQLVGWLPITHLRDYAYWLEISRRCHFHYLDDITAMYRIRQGTMSRPVDDYARSMFQRVSYEIVELFFERYEVEQSIRGEYYDNFFREYLNNLFRLKGHYRYSHNELANFKPSSFKDWILKQTHKYCSNRWPYLLVESPYLLARKLRALSA